MKHLVADPTNPLRWIPPTERSSLRIEGLDEVRRYIMELDLTGLEQRLTSGRDEGGLEWPPGKVSYYEPLYRNWLFLRRKYEGEALPPHADVDEFWHAHILDTHAYFRDCDRIFGYYLHHFPYFGTRGEGDRENLLTAWQNTQNRYRDEFGDYIYDYVE